MVEYSQIGQAVPREQSGHRYGKRRIYKTRKPFGDVEKTKFANIAGGYGGREGLRQKIKNRLVKFEQKMNDHPLISIVIYNCNFAKIHI